MFVSELTLGDRLTQTGIQTINALLRFSETRALAIHGYIVGLAVDLAGDGIKPQMDFSDRSPHLLAHGIDRIHGHAAVFWVDDKHGIPERVKVAFVLVQLGI